MTAVAAPKLNLVERWSAWWSVFRSCRELTAQEKTKPSAVQVVIWLVTTAMAAGLILSNFNSFELGAYTDDAAYVILARSIVEGGQYGTLNNPGPPGNPTFPFGFPLLLAPLVWAFPGNFDALKTVSLAATLINISLIFWGWPWLSRSTSRWWGLAIMLSYSLSPLTIDQARMVMSEPVFTTCCLVAYILTERLGRGQAAYKWGILLGVTLLALCSIRSVGICFAAGLLLDLFMALGRRALKPVALALIATAGAAALIIAFTSLRTNDIISPVQSYLEVFDDFANGRSGDPANRSKSVPARIAELAYLHLVGEFRSSVFALGGGDKERAFFTKLGVPFLKDVIGVSISLIVIIGVLRILWREGGSAFMVVLIPYGGALLLWNWLGNRFMYPILPQLLFGFFMGIDLVGLWGVRLAPGVMKNRNIQPVVVVGSVAMVIASFLYRTQQIKPSIAHVGSLPARTEWIKANTATDAVLLSESPLIDFVYSERHTVGLPNVAKIVTNEDLVAFMKAQQVDYVLVAPEINWQEIYAPVYGSNMEMLVERLDQLQASGHVIFVYGSPDGLTKVYQVVQ